jgi:3-oxoacyl-(acyl-carrier-protein) synthase
MSAVVTGLGAVGPYGLGMPALSRALERGTVPRQEVDRSYGFHRPGSARTAGLVDHAAYRAWLPALSARRMCTNSRMALASTRMAVDSAELEEADLRGERTAVCIGTAFASADVTVRMLEQIASGGPQSASPFLFMETVANAYAGHVALHFGAQGSNATVSQREASGSQALARALRLLEAKACDRVLVSCTDEMSPATHGTMDRFRALVRPDADGKEEARPFDAGRGGFFAAEGASALVLESEKLASERGAPVLARVRATIRANDPSAPNHGYGDGVDTLARALLRGLARCDLAPRDIQRIVSGANGSRAGDRLEALVLRRVWGAATLPPVLAPKATLGEYGGGFLAASILGASEQGFAPTPGFRAPDPELGIRPHAGETLASPKLSLVSSLAAGGAAIWLVLERP